MAARCAVGLVVAWMLLACGGEGSDGGEGELELDSRMDILINAAEGVLGGVQSVKAYFLEPRSTSCDGLTSRRVTPAEFSNRRDPVLSAWEGLGNPHVITEVPGGSSQILIECYPTEDGTGEPQAAGCDDDVYVVPGEVLNTSIRVRLNP